MGLSIYILFIHICTVTCHLFTLIYSYVFVCFSTIAALSTNGYAASATNNPTQNGGPAPKPSSGIQLPTPKRILYDRELVQIGWKNGRKWSVGTGMTNVGNTCYLNSTLQALFHVPSFANWLYSDEEHRRGGCDDTSKFSLKKRNRQLNIKSKNSLELQIFCCYFIFF